MSEENVMPQQPQKMELVSDAEFNSVFGGGNENTEEQGEGDAAENIIPEQINEQVTETNEQAVTETPKTEEVPAAPAAQSTPEPVAEIDPWEKLGFTDEKDKKYLEKFLEAYKNGESNDFHEKANKDYGKLTDTEVLRLKLQRENKGISAEDLDFLTENELEKYGITGEDDEADAKARRLLSIQLKATRESLINEQADYKANAYERKPSTQEIQAAKEWEDFVSHIDNHNSFTELGRSKSVAFGDFKAEMPAGIDPKLMAKDPSALMGQFYDAKTKSFDADKFIKTALFASNPDKYAADLIAYGKSLGTKASHDELRGASQQNNALPNTGKGKDKLQIIG